MEKTVKLIINKKTMGIISLLMFFILILPVKVLAVEEDEPVVSLDSFVVNSIENEVYNITMTAKTAEGVTEPINYSFKVFLVTNISEEGKEMVSGKGTTGEGVTFDVDMNSINSYSEYRFKILFEYDYNGAEQFSYGFSQKFEYEQQSYAEEMKNVNYTIDVLANQILIEWRKYDQAGDKAIISIDIDGETKEEMIDLDKGKYEIFFENDAKKVTINLKQACKGLLSKGVETVINLDSTGSNAFYLKFPEENERYSSNWNVEYYNANDTIVKWYPDNKSGKELTLNKNGSFMIEIDDENCKELTVEYNLEENIKWLYRFPVIIADYAPNITWLENYDGITVSTSKYTIAGKIDDKNAKISAEGCKVTQNDDGTFYIDVDLKDGKNSITIEAKNSIGKITKSVVTVYREKSAGIIEKNSILDKYLPLIITLTASVVLIIIMILLIRKRRLKNENQEDK